ncbi:MAG TPA: helix-turn-helix domain-containing protein [Acidimicrobiales bacterium]|nr:helix-turn-helix domain-containing protein [Acidimicrobiales bacterium]
MATGREPTATRERPGRATGAAAPQPAATTDGPPPPVAAGGPGRRAAHVEDTRRALLEAARQLFSERGYQATSTEEIVQRAGLTRGALYHHFKDKADLFEAVFSEVDDEVNRTLVRRTGPSAGRDPWELYQKNNEIYLDAASGNVAYRRICLIDGPAVFGWGRWSDRQHAEGSVRKIAEYVREAIDAGSIADQPVAPLSQLLAALGHQAVMYIATAEDPVAARRQMGECVQRCLEGLRVGDGSPAGGTTRAGKRKGA